MAARYDLIVVGSGVAGSTAAHRCRAAGWRVAVVDHLPFGGTCALRGCDPKKVLVGVAESVDAARRLRDKGFRGDSEVDWSALMRFKRSFTDPISREREANFANNGIDAIHGHARFRDRTSLAINGEVFESRFILLATGAVPMRLGIAGEEYLATSDDFLELDALPKRIVMVGGGYIAAEFSHIAARAGARVTVLERSEDMLPQFDPDLVALLREKSARLGIDLRLGTRVESIERHDGGFRVHTSSAAGAAIIEADVAIHAAGRGPDFDSLDLETGGVERDRRRLKLNTFLQSTSNPTVYAAGDAAASGPPLTPVAGRDGTVAAINMVEGNCRRVDYTAVPSVVFTIPPLARVGLLETEARKKGLNIRVAHAGTAGWYTARRVAEDCAGFKILVEEGKERVVGAHLIGPHAEETINLFALAIRSELSTATVKDAVFGYPTAGSDIGYML